jgi:tape measure domain-containing protein
VAESVVTLRVDASGATRALNGVQSQTNKLQSAFGGLRTALGGIGLTLLAKNAIQTSTNFEKLNVRLGLLTKASGTFARSQEIAADAQKAFGLSATEALEGITDITARLQPLGVGVEDIKSTFFGFNTAAKLAGASAIESSNAFRQLAQALGSGRLAGDEFRSISEQIPTLLAPIAEELDVNVGALKKFAAEGKLTSEVVLRALRQIETDGGASLKALLENDPTQVFKNLGNETENLSRAFGEALQPAVLPVIKALTQLTIAATEFVNSPIGKTALIFTAIAVAAKGVVIVLPLVSVALIKVAAAGGLATIALNAIPFVAVATGIGAIVTQLIKQRQEQDKVTQAIKDGEVAQLRALESDLSIKMAKEFAIIQSSNDKRSINAAERRLALLRAQYVPVRKRLDTVIQENAVEKEKNKTTQKNKEIQEEINKLEKENLKKAIAYEQAEMDAVVAKGKLIDRLSDQKALAQAALDGNLKQVQTQQEINALVAIHGEGMRDVITAYIEGTEALKKQKDEADELKDKFDQIGEAIESSIKDNLRDAITGAQSFGQAMTNVLNRIRDKIIDAQLDRLVGGISDSFSNAARGGKRRGLGGFLGGILGGLFKANGGPVKAGQPYIVGERQPELFVPRTSGTILPSVPMGGDGDNVTNVITVNVDASGSAVSGSNADGNELGQQIAVAIQSELIKQKRAGGLLS